MLVTWHVIPGQDLHFDYMLCGSQTLGNASEMGTHSCWVQLSTGGFWPAVPPAAVTEAVLRGGDWAQAWSGTAWP